MVAEQEALALSLAIMDARGASEEEKREFTRGFHEADNLTTAEMVERVGGLDKIASVLGPAFATAVAELVADERRQA